MTNKSLENSTVRLVEMRNGIRGQVFPVAEGSNLIGRWDPDSGAFPEIDLEAVDTDAKVSRKHAVLEYQSGTVMIEDLNSLNGTFINRGNRLRAGIREALKAGDEIIVGKVFLVLEIDS